MTEFFGPNRNGGLSTKEAETGFPVPPASILHRSAPTVARLTSVDIGSTQGVNSFNQKGSTGHKQPERMSETVET